MERVGDQLNWWFRLIPTYSLAQSIYFDSGGEILVQIRALPNGLGDPVDSDVWHINNVGGDIAFECFHFVFWFLVLAFIESGIFKKITCKRRTHADKLYASKRDSDVVIE